MNGLLCSLSCFMNLTLGVCWRRVQNVSGADPLGMEGVEHWGWAGDFGVADPAKYQFRRSFRLHTFRRDKAALA